MLFVKACSRGGYLLNAVPHSVYLSSRPHGTQCAAKLLLHGILLAVVGLIAPAASSAQAQHLAFKTLPAGNEEWNYTIHSWQSQDGLPEETV
jgi:hypothetical protein